PQKGGEGRGEEALFIHSPLSPTLSPLVPRREREKEQRERFACRTQLVSNLRNGRLGSLRYVPDAVHGPDACTARHQSKSLPVHQAAFRCRRRNHNASPRNRGPTGPEP